MQSNRVRRNGCKHLPSVKILLPVAQEPDFLENEDEPEVTLPEGYDEMDFDDRKKADQTEDAKDAEAVAQAEAEDSIG